MRRILSVCVAGLVFTGCFLSSDDESISSGSSKGEVSSSILSSSSSIDSVKAEKTAMELRQEYINTLPKYLNSAMWLGKVKEVKRKIGNCDDFQTVEDCRAYGKQSKKYSSEFYNEKGGLTSHYEFDSLGNKSDEGYNMVVEWRGGNPIGKAIKSGQRINYEGEITIVESYTRLEWNEEKRVVNEYINDTLVNKVFVSGAAMDSLYSYYSLGGVQFTHPSISYYDETNWWIGQKDYNDSLGQYIHIHERITEYDSEARLMGGTATMWGECFQKGVDVCTTPKAEISTGDYDEMGNPTYWAIRSPQLDSLNNITGFSVWMYEYEFEYWE